MILALLAAAAAGGDVAEIRALRGQTNAAITAHRAGDVRRIFADDYTAFAGSSGRPLSAEQTEQRLAAAFSDPTFLTYVRTPKRIELAASGKRAAESGIWLGLWRKSDGEMRLTGIYQATWVPRDGGWRLLNEAFVTLRCTGSRSCREVE